MFFDSAYFNAFSCYQLIYSEGSISTFTCSPFPLYQTCNFLAIKRILFLVLCILSSVLGLCCTAVVPLLFILCTSVVHLLSLCCSSHVLLFCLSSTSCTSLVLFKFIYTSSAFHLRSLRRSQDVLQRHTPVPFLFLFEYLYKIALVKQNSQPTSEFFFRAVFASKLHSKSDFPNP